MKINSNYKKIIENNVLFVSNSSKLAKSHLIIFDYCKFFKYNNFI